MKEKLEKYGLLLMAPFIMAMMLLVIYAIKGIYPFGSRSIAYYDMAQLYVPLYYHTYDVLHGTQGALWSWYSGGGVPMIDTLGSYVINPFNLFFYFVRRDKILESMSFFLMLKICFSAFSMSYYCKKTLTTMSNGWVVVSGMIYASCGYVIQYYTNIQFLNLVAIFPLVVYSLDRLLKGKRVLYSLLLALVFMENMQMVAMVCYFLVLYSGLNLWGESKEKKTKAVIDLGIGTLVGILLSAAVWLPSAISLLESARAKSSMVMISNLIYDLQYHMYRQEKLHMLFGSEFVIAFLLYCILRKRKVLADIKKELIMVGMLVLPVICEAANIMWHVGGYVEFPMRYGYMLCFMLLVLFGKIIGNWDGTTLVGDKLRNILGVIFSLVVGIFLFLFQKQFLVSGVRETDNFSGYWIIFAAITILMFCLFYFKISVINVRIFLVLQCFLGWYGFLAPTDYSKPECNPSFIQISEALAEGVSKVAPDVDSRIARVRDESSALNVNYPFIIRNSSMANWTYGENSNLLSLMHNLGYSESFTRVMDSGATAFTDALFGVRKLISINNHEDFAYRIISKAGILYLKENQAVYPFGMLTKKKVLEDSQGRNEFDYQNDLFKHLNDTEEDLFEIHDLTEYIESKEDEEYRYYIKVDVKQPVSIYLKINSNKLYSFSVNGELVPIPSLMEVDNTIYPAYFNNGLISCGYFEGGEVRIEMATSEVCEYGEVLLAQMNVELLNDSIVEQNNIQRQLEVGKNGINCKIDNPGYDYWVLPVGYQEGFEVSINNERVECLSGVGESLTLVPLVAGGNDIQIKYIPKGLNIGMLISFIGMIGILTLRQMITVLGKAKIIGNILLICFNTLFIVLGMLLSLFPIICDIVVRILYWTGIVGTLL